VIIITTTIRTIILIILLAGVLAVTGTAGGAEGKFVLLGRGIAASNDELQNLQFVSLYQKITVQKYYIIV